MKISQIITEVFDSDVRGTARKTRHSFITRATIGDREIEFLAHDTAGDNNWEIMFVENSKDRGATFGKSGSGNELKVFGFVIESLKMFIAQYHPDTVTFTSSNNCDGRINRSNLYTAIARKVNIPGYSMSRAPGADTDTFTIYADR